MSKRLILYGLWCLVLFLLALACALTGWTPFGDDERPTHASYYGPTHK